MLEYGKRMPRYEADGSQVTLHSYDGTFDHAMASLVARWHGEGKDIGLDGLIVLTYLKDHRFISTADVADLLQLERDDAFALLDTMSHLQRGILERKGHAKPVANDLIGKVAYSSSKGIDAARYAELLRGFVQDHGSITNRECRQLLYLGDTASAHVEASRYLRK